MGRDGNFHLTRYAFYALCHAIYTCNSRQCYEIRGNGEMFPLNGPSWSLFFEYIGNILYALFVRRLSTKLLTAIVVSLGIGYTAFAVFDASGYGNMGVGWTLDSINFLGGMLRMLFPFSMGLLLSRNFKPFKVKGSFWLASSILIIIFAIPYIPSDGNICYNGILEAVCVTLIFSYLGQAWSFRKHSRPQIHCNMQFSWENLLPSLYDSLPNNVPFLCMAD